MKIAFVLLASFGFAGCSHSSYKQVAGTVSQNGLSRFVDKDQKTVCYVYENSDAPSLSCLKIEE